MSETIVIEKSVTLKDGTLVNIRERTRDEGTILFAFLQYLTARLEESGAINYPAIATEADQLSRTLSSKFIFGLEARAETAVVGHLILIQHPAVDEQHMANVSVVVTPAYQNKGLGAFLLQTAIEFCPAKMPGVHKIIAKIFSTNEIALKTCIKTEFCVHGILPGRIKDNVPHEDQLILVKDIGVPSELEDLPGESRKLPKYFPHWRETGRERQEKLTLIGFLCGFDIKRLDEVDRSGIWDWASRLVLTLADRDTSLLQGRSRIQYLQDEGLRIIPLRYLRVLAKALGYLPPM